MLFLLLELYILYNIFNLWWVIIKILSFNLTQTNFY